MTTLAEQVALEIARLCRAGGVQMADVVDGLGPNLRNALGIRPGDQPEEVRQQLAAEFADLVRRLPSKDLQVSAIAALALASRCDPLLGRRLEWAAEQIDRDVRTVRRRVAQSEQRMAEHLAQRILKERQNNAHAPGGWYVDRLSAHVRLHTSMPQLSERREIVATMDDVRFLEVNVSVPQLGADRPVRMEAVAERGCELVRSERVTASNWRFRLALPHALQAGQRHLYEITFIVSDLAAIRPYYVLVPLRPCRFFSARIEFGEAPVAEKAWRLDGVPTSVLEDAVPSDYTYDLEAENIVDVAFDHPLQGLAYGVQWQWRAGALTS